MRGERVLREPPSDPVAVASPSSDGPGSVRRRLLADTTLLAAAVIWGSTFVIVKEAVAELPLMTFLALRFIVAFVALAVAFRRPLAANWRRLATPGLVMGLCLFAGLALQTTGLQFTQASRAGFITGLSVAFVPILEGALVRKWPPRRALAGVVLALCGLVLLFIVPAAGAGRALSAGQAVGAGPATPQLLGDLLVLGCALAFGSHIVSTGFYSSGRARDQGEAGALAAIQVGVAAAGYVVVCAVQVAWAVGAVDPGAAGLNAAGLGVLLPPGGTLAHPFSLKTAGAILMTGLLATAGAFGAQTLAQRFTPPTHTALIFATEPVFAAVFGWLWLGELLGPWGLGGCLLILAGTLVAELPVRRKADQTAGPAGPGPSTIPAGG